MENNAVDDVQQLEPVLKREPEEKSEQGQDVKCEEKEVEKSEEEPEVKCGEELKSEGAKCEGELKSEEVKCEEEPSVFEEAKVEQLERVEELEDTVDEEDGGEGRSRYRYTKKQLMEIKALPVSNERPICLSKRYDSDGVWDPEKWYALNIEADYCPLHDGAKRDDKSDERPTLKRRIQDPRERVKEDDLDVVLSPQRRSFGSGCQGSAAAATPPNRRPISPLETPGSGRRIGSGRIMTRSFERDARMDKDRGGERERDRAGDRERDRAGERERDYKDKRFRRDFVDKRTFNDRRRTDSYAEEEPEWFSAGPSSQFETIELSGFDDKFLEDDKRKSKRSRKRTESTKEASGLNGAEQAEEQGAASQASADQEVPHNELPDQPSAEFDFNEFFSQDPMPSVLHNLLTDGPVLVSRFTQWFATTSPTGSQSGSRRSTPHEELEELGGPVHVHTATYFKPIRPSDNVDIVELLQRANVDVETLSTNRAQLRENIYNGVVLSVEEVEGEMQGMKLNSSDDVSSMHDQNGTSTQLNRAFINSPRSVPFRSDDNMSAFDKLVSTMMASGTLPAQPAVDSDHLRVPFNNPVTPQAVETPPSLAHSPATSAPSSLPFGFSAHDLIRTRLQTPPGIAASHTMHDSYGPGCAPLNHMCLPPRRHFHTSTPKVSGVERTFTVTAPQTFDQDPSSDDAILQATESVDQHPQMSEAAAVPPARNILYQAFTPTSVIRNLYATRERTREESSVSPGTTDTPAGPAQDGNSSPNPVFDGPALQSRTIRSGSQNLAGIDMRGFRPGAAGSRSQHVPTQFPAFLSPIYPAPLRPVVRPSAQLHPHVMPRMMAGRMQTHGVRPSFMRGRVYPHNAERSQHLSNSVFNRQPVYPVSTAGYVNPRASIQSRPSAGQFQRHANAHPQTPYPQQRIPPPPGDSSPDLTRWFGSEVLEQPLPSMPTAVISVEELEFAP